MKRIGEFIKWFFYITTSILIVCAVGFGLDGEAQIPAASLWQILVSGFLTTIVTVLIVFRECNKKSTIFLKHFFHYLALCAVMILCGHWFGWLDFDFDGILMMAISVAVVYILSAGAYCIIDLRQASEINQRLKDKYDDC
ncbi:MAG: DUF3021 family protein [Lachnospiraceae bacterium]|nr:DUF3021 family protein [Lachnospiraceae bacterium]